MARQSFTFSLSGKSGTNDHSFIRIEYEPPLEGSITLALAHSMNAERRSTGIASAVAVAAPSGKKVRVFRWDYQDAALIESNEFDIALSIGLVSHLEAKRSFRRAPPQRSGKS